MFDRLRSFLRREDPEPRRPPWHGPPPALKAAFGDMVEGLRENFINANPADLADTFAASVWVYAATNARAQALADVPFVVQDAEGNPAPTWHRLAQLLTPRLMWTLEADLCLVGMALLVKLANRAGVVTELRRINPKMFTVDSTERDGLLGFRVQGSDWNYLEPEQVVFVHLYDPSDDFGAVAPAEVALTRAGSERAMMEYALSWFANNAVPGALLMPPANADALADYDRGAEDLSRDLREFFRGAGNANKAMALAHRWEVWESQKSPDGVAMPALAEGIKQTILAAFGIAESILTSGASNYAEAQSDRLNFYQSTIRPRATLVAEAFEEQLAHPHFGAQWQIVPDFSQVPAMQADRADRIDMVNAQVERGYMTLAEARKETYLPEDPRLADYILVRGVPVHMSKLAELYETLPAPQPQPQPGFGGAFMAVPVQEMPARQIGQSSSAPSMKTTTMIDGDESIAEVVEESKDDTQDAESEDDARPFDPAAAGDDDDDARPFAPRPAGGKTILHELANWQRAALKGQPFVPAHTPAAIALPLHGRLASAGRDEDALREAFHPAFGHARAIKARGKVLNLDRWWDDYADREEGVAEALEALWREMAGAMVEALEGLPTNAPAETITAALVRAMRPYEARHEQIILPFAQGMFVAGAGMGLDQVQDVLKEARAAKKATPPPKELPPLGVLWNQVNRDAVEWAGQYAGENVKNVLDTTRNRVRRLVAKRIEGGFTHEELVRELQQIAKGSPDDENGFKHVFGHKRAELIAQTESTRAMDQGQENVWLDNGLWMARWYTAGDKYVCPLCRALDGKVTVIGDKYEFTADELKQLSDEERKAVQGKAIRRPVENTHPGCRCLRRPAEVLEHLEILRDMPMGTDSSEARLEDLVRKKVGVNFDYYYGEKPPAPEAPLAGLVTQVLREAEQEQPEGPAQARRYTLTRDKPAQYALNLALAEHSLIEQMETPLLREVAERLAHERHPEAEALLQKIGDELKARPPDDAPRPKKQTEPVPATIASQLRKWNRMDTRERYGTAQSIVWMKDAREMSPRQQAAVRDLALDSWMQMGWEDRSEVIRNHYAEAQSRYDEEVQAALRKANVATLLSDDERARLDQAMRKVSARTPHDMVLWTGLFPKDMGIEGEVDDYRLRKLTGGQRIKMERNLYTSVNEVHPSKKLVPVEIRLPAGTRALVPKGDPRSLVLGSDIELEIIGYVNAPDKYNRLIANVVRPQEEKERYPSAFDEPYQLHPMPEPLPETRRELPDVMKLRPTPDADDAEGRAYQAEQNRRAREWFFRGEPRPNQGRADRVQEFASGAVHQAKRTIAREISRRTGIPENVCSEFVRQWAQSSNGFDYRSLGIQKEAARIFDAAVSEWQDVQIRQKEWEREAVLREDTEDLPVSAAYLFEQTAFDRDMVRALERDFPSNTGPGIPYDEADEMVRALVRAMYDNTQEELKAAGVETVTLYRGIVLDRDEANEMDQRLGDDPVNQRVLMGANTLESWTIHRTIAERFGKGEVGKGWLGLVVRMDVPVSRIVGTARTGFGCLNEYEFVVLGNGEEEIEVIEYHNLNTGDEFKAEDDDLMLDDNETKPLPHLAEDGD